MAIDISIGNCVCGNLEWQLHLEWQMRLRKFQISNGNRVCRNLKSQMAIAFAEISNLKWQSIFQLT